MLMPITSEFVALCRAQIALLTQALGASISIVYLTKELVEGAQTQLVPVASYPDVVVERERLAISPMLPVPGSTELTIQSRSDDSASAQSGIMAEFSSSSSADSILASFQQAAAETNVPPRKANSSANSSSSLVDQRQIVLPLIHEDVVFGLLVTRRDDRSWASWEQTQVEEIAHTLAIAYVMDQRYRWLEREREQERMVQMQQHDLMDNLLHQFRNSLTALQTFGKLILRRLLPAQSGHEIANNMVRETERLRDLSQQLELALRGWENAASSLPLGINTSDLAQNPEHRLDGTKLDGTKPILLLPAAGLSAGSTTPLQLCLVELVLNPLLMSAGAIAEEKGLLLQSYLPEDLPPVWATAAALREIFNNLIENAMKYTPAGGAIVVRVDASETSPWLEVSVSDTGPGIPPQDLEHLFERHYRGMQAAGPIPGSGLGLAIARALVEQLQGKIQVFSPALAEKLNVPGFSPLPTHGLGTTFLVYLAVAVQPGD